MAEAVKKLTIFDLQAKADRGEKVFQVTAVDYPTAQLVDRAGIDCILIGDSLGMTALGYSSTVPVTMDEMIHHAKAISRAVKRALVVGDLPLGAYHASAADAVNSAMRMVKEGGADVVKLEGGEDFAPMAAGGGQGRHSGHGPHRPDAATDVEARRLSGAGQRRAKPARSCCKDALAMEQAGCFAIVLEAIPDRVAQIITERLRIPTIGIGAGPHCDGQNLVLHDMVGLFDRFTPKFVKRYANCWEIISKALTDFQDEVHKGEFPMAEHSFTMKEDEYQAMLQQLPKQ